jgi:hypothetical protein
MRLLTVLVPWNVVVLALLHHILDPTIKLLDLLLLLDDLVDMVLNLLLDVVPFDLAEITAGVVDLALNSDVPAVTDDRLGPDHCGLDVVLEVFDDSLPLMFDVGLHFILVVKTALSAGLAGIIEWVPLRFFFTEIVSVNEVAMPIQDRLDLVLVPVSDG